MAITKPVLKKRPLTKKPGRPPKSSQQDDPSNNLKAKILTATIELIAERGFDGFTLRDVAHVVGVHTALVGYYYGSKTKLESAAMESQLGKYELLNQKNHEPSTLAPAEALKILFFGRVRNMNDQPTLYRFMLWINAKGGNHAQQLNERYRMPFLQTVAGLMRDLHPRMNAAESNARAAALLNMAEGCSNLYWNYSQDLNATTATDERIKEHHRIVETQLLPSLLKY